MCVIVVPVRYVVEADYGGGVKVSDRLLSIVISEKNKQIKTLEDALESCWGAEADYIALNKRMESEIERLKGLVKEATNLIVPNETEDICSSRREYILSQLEGSDLAQKNVPFDQIESVKGLE